MTHDPLLTTIAPFRFCGQSAAAPALLMAILGWIAPQSALACDTCTCHSHGPAMAPPAAPLAVAAGAPIDSTLRFAVVGDTQGLQFVQKLVTDMNALNPQFVIFPGDLVGTGSAQAFAQWNSLSDHFIGGADQRYMVPGNHDLWPGGPQAAWQAEFNWLPSDNSPPGFEHVDYYFDKGDSRFISISGDNALQHGGVPVNIDWLNDVLSDPETQAKDHVFLYSHRPITFPHYDGTEGTDGPFWEAVNRPNVTAIFVGHWHQYQPSQPQHPHSHTWEIIIGTGNAGFSGFPWQNKIGFGLVEVDGPRATLSFYGDADGDGNYNDILDTIVLRDTTPAPRGLVGYYGFNDPQANLDLSYLVSDLSKLNHGFYTGDAQAVSGGVFGLALEVQGDGFAVGSGIGDYNLAILGDLTIAIHAKYDTLGRDPGDNTLVSYTADVAGHTDRDEAVNQPYNLRLRSDKKLELMWERDDQVKEIFTSSVAALVSAGQWHEYRVTRDAASGEIRFYVDGQQLGDVILFDPATLPTGGAQGFLRIGMNYDRDNPAKLTGGFIGLLDELAIWNQVTLDSIAGMTTPFAGDLNLDGVIDEEDWAILLEHQHSDLSGLSPFQAGLRGDLTGDLRNNHEDFVAFKRLFESLNGQGAFDAMVASLPEPGSLSLLLAGAAIGGRRRRRAS